MTTVQQYFDWRAVWFGTMSVEEYNAKYPKDQSFRK
jgi:hypothetical protein